MAAPKAISKVPNTNARQTDQNVVRSNVFLTTILVFFFGSIDDLPGFFNPVLMIVVGGGVVVVGDDVDVCAVGGPTPVVFVVVEPTPMILL